MIVLKGNGVFQDIAFGTLSINQKNCETVNKYSVTDSENEIDRYRKARDAAVKQIRNLYEKSLRQFGAVEAEIFAVHEMMIRDKDYENTIIEIIKSENLNAEYAVWETSRKFSKIFSDMDDEYMKQKASDVKDISERIINCLSGSEENFGNGKNHIIISAEDLTPSEVSSLNKHTVKGIILSKGSECSHAAIISKVLKIPSVINIEEELKPEYSGKDVIIDSFSGTVYIDPDEETQNRFSEKKKNLDKRRELLKHLKGKDNVTLDGKRIDIYANLNNPEEISEVLENDAGGIGLFRSEFLYLDKEFFPTEDEQFEVYKDIAQKMGNKRVIIRTIDIGSDKYVTYFNFSHEENPALGYRGIRVCLDNPDIFMTQLKAIYRASAFGNISIMFPMIISSEEIDEIKKYIEIAKKDLIDRNVKFSENVPLGIMIETPAAAIISDELASKVDFFSIGTNDLTQYTLAIDRQNGKIKKSLNTHHKAVLRLIKTVVDNAHKNGIWVGICGELASDESLTEMFLSIGVDELSVSPSSVLNIRKKVTETDIGKIRDKIIDF